MPVTQQDDLWAGAPKWNPEGRYEGAGGSGEAVHGDRPAINVRPPKAEPEDIWKDAPKWQPDADYGKGPSYVPPSATAMSVARQLPAGFNEGLADFAGMPVDLMTAGINKMVAGGGWQPPAPQSPGPPTSQWTPPTGLAPSPAPPSEPFIQNPIGGSEFLKSGLGLIGADPRATLAQNTPERIARGIGSGAAAMMAPEALLGVLEKVGAATPQVVKAFEQIFGKSTIPVDATKAQIAGTVAKPAVIGGVTGGTGEAAAERVPEEYKPLARMGAAALTAPLAIGAMAAPGAIKETVQQFTRPLTEGGREIVAGKALEKIGPGAAKLRELQPTGSPVEVSNAVRASLADIDAMTGGAVERATQEARGAREGLGGAGTPEQYGAALRTSAQDAENAARKREGDLWQAIDPKGKLTVSVNPVKDVADSVYGNLSEAAKSTLSPAERSLTDVISNYSYIEPFRELTDLRSAVSAEMRKEFRTSGRTPTYARLSQLRGGLEDALTASVQQEVAQDARAVARGEMSSDATLAARLQREADTWRAGRADAQAPAAGGMATVSGDGGTARQAGRGPGNAPSDQGIPPTLDQSAQDRLAAATAATRGRVATYGKPSGPVGQILRPGEQRGEYKVPSSAVGEKIFTAGPGGFENVQAYRRATANDAEALNTLQDYIASRLQRAAGTPDGVLDPKKTANWLKAHSEAMRAFPELAARFQDAAAATSTVEDMAALRKHALDSAQKGELAPLIGAENDAAVTKTIGGFLQKNDVRALAKMNADATTPAAREGARKAAVDWMYEKFITSAVEAEKGGKFQSFMRTSRPALRQIFSEEEVNAMSAMAADLDRTKDVLKKFKKPEGGGGHEALSFMTQLMVAAAAGYEHAEVKGAVTLGGSVVAKKVIEKLVGAARARGMEQIGDMVKEAMLNPQRARELLAKVPPKAAPLTVSAGQSMTRAATIPPQQQSEQRPTQ